MSPNLQFCNKCQQYFTSEENATHKHGEIRDLKIIGRVIWIDDGILYPLRILPTKLKRLGSPTRDETEPSN